MSVKRMKKLNEQDLGDIILCEPVTNRGIQALENLGLEKVVSENDFFDRMYITPKYAEDALFTEPVNDPDLEYVYSVSKERFNEMKRKLEDFNIKFTSDSISQSPLLIIGTAGNGKSIEVNKKVRNPLKDNEEIKYNRIIYNLEKSFTEVPYVVMFSLRDFLEEEEIDALWLTCMVLLDELYKLVKKHWKNIPTITKNHQKYFIKNDSADDTDKKLFSCIKKYKPSNSNTAKHLFEAMIELINKNNASLSIENLLKKTMNVMYCICPENKNYIVFDNLEHFIELNAQNIPITNEALSKIYKSVINVTENVVNVYNRINFGESWRAFKIILVLRRTSGHLLTHSDAHYATKLLGMGNDYTGHFDIWRIWEKKKLFIWEEHLKANYDQKQSSEIFWIIDDMMEDKPGVLGTSYQERISPLMNSGIRRNGRSQVHAAMRVYEILLNYNDYCINFETYKKIIDDKLPVTRYLYRRALLELQYKWMVISTESQLRFEKLLLGKLSDEKESYGIDRQGHEINMREVVYETDNCHVTLVRRILSYLSNCKDDNVVQLENGDGFTTGLFATKSFYDLMAGVFLNPVEYTTKELNNRDHFLPLSKVLISLGSMSHSATKAAPFVILDINDPRYVSSDSENTENVFSDILEEIWKAGAEKSTGTGYYKCNNYGVRLTEAGDVFLRDIQPSFSFFAALYCSEEVPLFFLTDPERIKFVITSVYNAADSLCKDYELAASTFCGSNVTLQKSKYLPKHKGKPITFRHRVMDMHSEHLKLYKDFIGKNAGALGLTKNKSDLSDLLKHIEKTISSGNSPSYNGWEDNVKRNIECF